ncbi:MAG TPA: SET domain-containing protein [Longimicrobium sp.]|jgi:hypothetical protein|uniref:SET domain-containing protein n=1 Tax=Longimicrobium sp. TaxID=2029185 RepID=UPI002ED805BA
MTIPGIRVAPCGGKGRGLVAEAPIPAGTVVWAPCPACSRWTGADLADTPAHERERVIELGYYLADGSVLLPCSGFCFINHSCRANVLDSLRGYALAVDDIAPGQELTYDYRVFVHEPPWSFACACGSPECVGTIRSSRALAPGVVEAWNARLAPALARMDRVPQPLAPWLAAHPPRAATPAGACEGVA